MSLCSYQNSPSSSKTRFSLLRSSGDNRFHSSDLEKKRSIEERSLHGKSIRSSSCAKAFLIFQSPIIHSVFPLPSPPPTSKVHKLFSNTFGKTAYSQKHLITITYAKFWQGKGKQAAYIIGNSRIVIGNQAVFESVLFSLHFRNLHYDWHLSLQAPFHSELLPWGFRRRISFASGIPRNGGKLTWYG